MNRAIAMVLLMLLPGQVLAYCGWEDIHITPDYTVPNLHESGCSAEIIVGEPLTLYFVLVKDIPFDPITRMDFTVPNWPSSPDPADGRMDFSWSASSISGDLQSGIRLDWAPPLVRTEVSDVGFIYLLGSVEIESFNPSWLAEPLVVLFSDLLGTGWNDWGEWFEVFGSAFGFNTEMDYCDTVIVEPLEYTVLLARHILPLDGTSVPAQFDLEFDVIAEYCWYPVGPFVGSVSVFGEVVMELEGGSFASFIVPIDASGHPPGTEIPVVIDLEFFNAERHIELSYILDDVAVEPASLSTIKARY